MGYIRMFSRFEQVSQAIKSYDESSAPKNESYYNSSTIRITEWKYGYEMFKDNWLIGVGTGDVKAEALKRYKADNFSYGIEHFETFGSQYLYTAIILGTFGLTLLIAAYFAPLYLSVRYKEYLYAGFLLIFIFNSLTGTLLTGSSILIYGFFNSYLFAGIKTKDN